MKDFFLNFYFQLIEPNTFKIQQNTSGLLFPYAVNLSENGYFVPNFSGKAFELFVRNVFENPQCLNNQIKNKTLLKDENYSVLDHWKANEVQFDLIISHKADKIIRLIECKWGTSDTNWLDEIKKKPLNLPKGKRRMDVIVVSEKLTDKFLNKAKEMNVVVLELEDFYQT